MRSAAATQREYRSCLRSPHRNGLASMSGRNKWFDTMVAMVIVSTMIMPMAAENPPTKTKIDSTGCPPSMGSDSTN